MKISSSDPLPPAEGPRPPRTRLPVRSGPPREGSGSSRGLVRACWVLRIEMAVVVLGVLVSAARSWLGPVTADLRTDHATDPVAAGTRLREGARLAGDGMVQVQVPDPSPAQSSLAVLGQLPSALLVTVLLWWLLRLARLGLREGAFTPRIAAGLTRLGQVLVVGGALVQLIEIAGRWFLSDTLSAVGPDACVTLLPLGVWVLLGTGCIVLGEVVHAGSGLRTELDGVV